MQAVQPRQITPVLGSQLWGVVQLVRPLNFVMFMAGVVIGGVLVAGEAVFVGDNPVRLAMAALSAALIGGGANALNDVYDLSIDRINRPGRPLPRGLVHERVAWGIWGIGSLLGFVLGAAVSVAHGAMAAGAILLLWAYSARFKRLPLLGNLVVSLIMAEAIVYGGWAMGAPGPALTGGGFAMLTTLAREIAKDVEDMQGDQAEGARTLPLVAGAAIAVRWILGSVLLIVILTPIPYLALGYSPLYLVAVGVADAFLLAAAWGLLSTAQPERQAHQASVLLKVAMVAGLVALAVA